MDGFCWGMQYKYNERLKMLNHKLKAKCKTQRDFLAVYRFLIFCSQRTEQNKDWTQALSLEVVEFGEHCILNPGKSTLPWSAL